MTLIRKQWPLRPIVALGVTTTGTDPRLARLVTAALVETERGKVRRVARWVISTPPGVAIPEESTARHGWTAEETRAEGLPLRRAIAEITKRTALWTCGGETPLVLMGAPYVATLMHAEATRAAGRRLLDTAQAPVLDPLVMDRRMEPHRSGRRSLAALAAAYDVPWVGPAGRWDAAVDALVASRVVVAMAGRSSAIAGRNPDELHARQRGWALEQQGALRAHYERRGDTERALRVPIGWPLMPHPVPIAPRPGRAPAAASA